MKKTKKTRTSITLNDDILLEIKMIALKKNTSMTKLLEIAAIKYLDELREEMKEVK